MGSDTPNYAEMTPPTGKDPEEYTYVERRCELYRLIEEAGHPHNLERSQEDLGERYGVTQKMISKDIQRLREYESKFNSGRAKAVTSWLAEKAVMEHIDVPEGEQPNFDEAFEIQMRYNEFLFQLGELEEAPTALTLEGNAGEAYMEMMRQAAEDE